MSLQEMHPACSHAVCQFMGCRDHPTEDSGDQERSVHRGPSRNPCIGNAREYIFVFIYLTAVGLPPPALSVLE